MLNNQVIKKLAKKIYKLSLNQDQATVSKVSKGIIDFFSRRNQLTALKKLINELERLDLKSKGIKPAKVSTANLADARLAKDLLTATGANLQPEFVTDPKLIAGVKIETEDELMDGTVLGKLSKLD